MSLHGSLETFALTDVLALLSSTHKSGELRIVGDHSQGSVWVDAGRLVQTVVPRAVSHVDALFELLRLPDGMFTFEQGVAAPQPEEPAALDELVAKALARLDEWRLIEAVVPSGAARVRLHGSIASEVRIAPEQWQVLVAAVDGGTVDAVGACLGVGEFEACRSVRDLVELGLVEIARGGDEDVAGAGSGAAAEPVVAGAADVVAPPAARKPVGAALTAVLSEVLADVPADDGGAGEDDDLDEGRDDARDPGELAAVGAPAQLGRRDERDLDVPLLGQPLPAWALADDDSEDGDAVAGVQGDATGSAAGDDDDAPDVARRLHALGVTPDMSEAELARHLAAAEGVDGVVGAPGEEPINRGLLLKFLSSVRS